MFRFCFALSASAILSLALCSPTARAQSTLTHNNDGTSTMQTNYGPGDPLNHTTEFDAQGNVTTITWQGPPTTIVEYDALGRVNTVTVVQDNIKTVRTNIYFPGGIIRYWVRVLQIDEDGKARLVKVEGFWGNLDRPRGNAGNCVTPPPVPPGKTYTKDKEAKCQPGSNKSETKSNAAGAGRELRSVPAGARIVPVSPVHAPRTVQHGLPMGNAKSATPRSR